MPGKKLLAISLGGFVLALTFRLGIVFATGQIEDLDRTEMERVSLNLARYGEFANPYILPTGLTAHVAPGYPLVLGVIFRLFGEGVEGELVKQVVACVASSLRAALLPILGAALGLSLVECAVAGALGAFFIGAFDTELKGDWEGPLAAAVLMLLLLWAIRWKQSPDWQARSLFAYGLAWGIALLISPSLLPVLFGIVAAGAIYVGRNRPKHYAKTLLYMAIGVVLILVPWIIRNQLRLGGFVWGRDNFGLEMWVSNGPGAHWSNPRNGPRIYKVHPLRSPEAAEQVRMHGEIAFNRRCMDEARTWVISQPAEFARLTALRAVHFWFPPGRNRVHQIGLAVVTLAAWVGFGFARARSGEMFAMVCIIWLTYPLAYYVVQWSSRYRVPIDWTLILCVSIAICHSVRPLRRRVG